MSFLAVVAAAFVAEPIIAASEFSQDLEVPEYRPIAVATDSSLSGPVTNAFHLWDIQEIYSNADGSVQFVELFCSTSGQQFLSGHTLRLEQISPVSTLNTFNFANSGTPTTNATLLIGTSNLGTLYGVTPDQVMPANFLSTSGTNKRVNCSRGC